MGAVRGGEVDTQEENDERENEASTNMVNGYSDRLGAVRTINNTIHGKQQSRKNMTITNSDV